MTTFDYAPEVVQERVAAVYDRIAAGYDDAYRLPVYQAQDAVIERRVWNALIAGGLPSMVLDLGCGTGYVPRLLGLESGSYVGVDVSGRMIDIARSRLPRHAFMREDALSFLRACRSQAFTVVTALWQVLNHLPRLLDVVEEVARVLRPGGRFIAVAHAERAARRGSYTFDRLDGAPSWPMTHTRFQDLCGLARLEDVRVRGLTFAHDRLPARAPRWLHRGLCEAEHAILGPLIPGRASHLILEATR